MSEAKPRPWRWTTFASEPAVWSLLTGVKPDLALYDQLVSGRHYVITAETAYARDEDGVDAPLDALVMRPADADYLLRAVNSYDDLLAACEHMLLSIADKKGWAVETSYLRSVIAQATGKESP